MLEKNAKQKAAAILHARWLVSQLDWYQAKLGWSLRDIKTQLEKDYDGYTVSLGTLQAASAKAKERLPKGIAGAWAGPKPRPADPDKLAEALAAVDAADEDKPFHEPDHFFDAEVLFNPDDMKFM